MTLHGWYDSRMINRGHMATKKWQQTGVWVVTRSDPEYPWRLKQWLKIDSPPVLFGRGNKALLNGEGLAVIGFRNTNASGLTFTDHIGVKATDENVAIAVGAARRVDKTAILGATRQGSYE